MTRYFHYSSLAVLVLLLAACSPVSRKGFRKSSNEGKTPVTWHSPFLQKDFSKALFKAAFHIGKRDLTGLVLIKKVADSTFHFYFASEFGMTFFELKSSPGKMETAYIFEPMNKKSLLSVLENDLELLFFAPDPVQKEQCLYADKATDRKLIRAGEVWYEYPDSLTPPAALYSGSNPLTAAGIQFSGWKEGFPASVIILNKGIGLRMDLTLIRLN